MSTSIRRGRFAAFLTIVAVSLLFATSACAQSSGTTPQAASPQAAAAQANAAPTAEDRMKELEERIIALEGQVRMLKQQAANGPTATAPAEAAPAIEPEPAPPPAGLGGATSMAKALNPDISLIGNFVGSAGHNSVAGVPSLEMREAELGVQAVVDPYARADFFISFGEAGVNLEEGYITFTALPAGFVAKVGKMRSAFGKVNTMHAHVLPWIDRPVMTDNLVGGEDGIDDAGFSITRGFAGPKGTYLEATGQVFRGDSADVFQQSQKQDISAVAHLRAYRDLTESTNLDVGLSYARGHNDVGSDFVTSLYGVDATLRWKPLRRSIYHSFIARSELVWSQRQQLPVEQRAFGMYAAADYQLNRRWFAGVRYDWSDRARNAALNDKGGSVVVTYWPSEFAQLRGQYRYVDYANNISASELRFQVMFAIGAHGAHPF